MTSTPRAPGPGWAILETIFPGRCLICGSWLLETGRDASPVCAECTRSLEPMPVPRCDKCGIMLVSEKGVCTRCREADFAFSSNLSLFAYQGQVKALLQDLKFEGRSRVARFFSGLLFKSLEESSPGIPVVPVPGRRKRDAVELLARSLESRHGIRVLRFLQRSGGDQQKSLDFQQRKRNIQGRFQISPHARGAGPGLKVPAEVVLLDDIFTTGATADACALVLREAGCSSVRVLTVAMEI